MILHPASLLQHRYGVGYASVSQSLTDQSI
jgi:hypothetical protein